MKRLKLNLFLNILILSFISGCTLKYTKTGKIEPVSQKIENVSYIVKEVSQPAPQNPYLILNIKGKGVKTKIIKEEYIVKKEIPLPLSILTGAIGIGGGIFFSSKGYVVFGRDLWLLGLGASASMITYNFLKKISTIWKEEIIKIPEYEFIPVEPFEVKLQGTEYSSIITPEKNGDLKINLLEFAPFYKKGKPFYFSLFSPKKENLGEFKVNPEVIAQELKKAKLLKYPPSLSFTSSFDDSTGDRNFLLNAEETGRIVLFVKNTGPGIARDLEVKITLKEKIPGLKIPENIRIDIIGLKEEKKIVIPIKATREIPTSLVEAEIKILEPYFQADAEPQILKFETRKFEPPELVISDKGVEESEVVRGKSASISLIIYNQGVGRAENVTAQILVPPGITYLGDSSIFHLGKMEPGEWKRIDFPVFVGARYEAESLKINLRLNEKREEFSKSLTVSFPLNKPVQKIKEVVIKGVEEKKAITLPPRLTSDVDINIPQLNIQNPDAIAVIIGNKSYEEEGVPDVEYAENDARVLEEYLIKTLGYKKENIIFQLNAKKSDFERIFGTEKEYKGMLYNYVKPNKSDVFIYYTGHGAPDIETKSAYFVPVDCHPDYVRLNGYALETFYKNLAQIPAKSILVVIDACFSGASEKGMLIAQASPLVIASLPKEVMGNLNVFTSSGPEEISSWYPEQRHSLFTYYFLKSLRGECDKNKDKIITLGEIKEYCIENVSYWAQRLFNRKQIPTFKGCLLYTSPSPRD